MKLGAGRIDIVRRTVINRTKETIVDNTEKVGGGGGGGGVRKHFMYHS